MVTIPLMESKIEPNFMPVGDYKHFPATAFPTIHPVHWLHSHFAVGGWSPLQRISGMLTAHMTRIAPRNGFTWHPHRGLEIYTWVLEGQLYHEDTTGGKGVIQAGELQRMFAGDYIQHQELNLTDEPTRVIQIWYIADLESRGLPPHYQQVAQAELPVEHHGSSRVYQLIGENSPMEQHIQGRLTATVVERGGAASIQPPAENEDLFLYITDGVGQVNGDNDESSLGQYDVILARPSINDVTIQADDDAEVHYLSFYLPRFLS